MALLLELSKWIILSLNTTKQNLDHTIIFRKNPNSLRNGGLTTARQTFERWIWLKIQRLKVAYNQYKAVIRFCQIIWNLLMFLFHLEDNVWVWDLSSCQHVFLFTPSCSSSQIHGQHLLLLTPTQFLNYLQSPNKK